MSEENEETNLLPHHEQQELCTARLPYRQGRKLTAVKVYTINNESRHLLIFGVPSLNLRREAKDLLKRFGKLLEFTITTKYPTEKFTENYHAVFENIHAARLAKKKLDTMNFYGGSLHICYAPELETIEETRNKLYQRQRDVLGRLKNLEKEEKVTKSVDPISEPTKEFPVQKKLNMGKINIIGVGKQIKDVVMSKKRKPQHSQTPIIIQKRFKPCFVAGNTETTEIGRNIATSSKVLVENPVEVIDCTSTETETITNINESLNYNKFGREDIRTIPQKPVNKIKFNFNNK